MTNQMKENGYSQSCSDENELTRVDGKPKLVTKVINIDNQNDVIFYQDEKIIKIYNPLTEHKTTD